jgi:Second Messenger Oligonucleotide or Dinucleotide Synthetase domain
MTVSDDFSAFNDACKIPTVKISSIANRYQRITRQLNRDFWTTESETAHSLYTGSYGRDTAARGISDLDMGFTPPVALYDQYRNHAGNGPSQLLQAVRRSMQKTYPTSDVAGMARSSESWEPQQRPHPWHRCAGGGAVHSINNGRSLRFALAIRQLALCLTKKHNFISPKDDRKRGSSDNKQSQ